MSLATDIADEVIAGLEDDAIRQPFVLLQAGATGGTPSRPSVGTPTEVTGAYCLPMTAKAYERTGGRVEAEERAMSVFGLSVEPQVDERCRFYDSAEEWTIMEVHPNEVSGEAYSYTIKVSLSG